MDVLGYLVVLAVLLIVSGFTYLIYAIIILSNTTCKLLTKVKENNHGK